MGLLSEGIFRILIGREILISDWLRMLKIKKCKCVKNDCKTPKLFSKESLKLGAGYKCRHRTDPTVAKEKKVNKVILDSHWSKLPASDWSV